MLTVLLTYVLAAVHLAQGLAVVIWRRNRFQGTGSKFPEPVPKPGTRNRFLIIVSLIHCIICVLYESLFVNNESRNIGLKLIRLSFHFFIHSFNLFVAFISSQIGLGLLRSRMWIWKAQYKTWTFWTRAKHHHRYNRILLWYNTLLYHRRHNISVKTVDFYHSLIQPVTSAA